MPNNKSKIVVQRLCSLLKALSIKEIIICLIEQLKSK